MMQRHKPTLLMILDGWGYSDHTEHNPIYSANTPNWDQYWQQYPHTLLDASGHSVGLPSGQMGNSEVGHMTIGAGRLIDQDFTRINKAIIQGEFEKNTVLEKTIHSTLASDRAIHIIGLLSPGGVHSHEDQIAALVKLAADRGVEKLYIHAILDGRDVAPKSARSSLEKMTLLCKQYGQGRIVSIIGRYYAMDRDNRWERTQAAYDLYTTGEGAYCATSALQALDNAYHRGETDEFVKPTWIGDADAAQVLQSGDTVIWMNFRSDRARQLSHALVDSDFNAFERHRIPQIALLLTLTEYEQGLDAEVIFPPKQLKNTLGEVISTHNYRQLRIAETEKYAHVTFFFNGGIEQPYTNEERLLIPSPKVANYDLKPEMSAPELTDQLVMKIMEQQHDLIICNYANPDMVGHTGNHAATIKAIEVIDQCIGRVVDALQAVGGECLITADHGNAEWSFNQTTQQPHTAHTTSYVPFVYLGRPAYFTTPLASLTDIAPTILSLMGLPVPDLMTGQNILRIE